MPYGTAMPLGKFQENLHLRKGLPLIFSSPKTAPETEAHSQTKEGR
jgi:hypothetical protein